MDESFYFKPEQLLRIISHCDRKVEEGCGFKAQFHTEDEISGCVTTRYGQRETDPAIKEGISIHPLNRKMEFQGFNSIQSDVAPCLTAHDGRGGEPCLRERTDKIMKLGNYTPKGTHAGTLVSPEGIAPTVMGQHGTVTGIVEPVMKQVGAIYNNNAQAGRVYDVEGIAPCLDICCGGNRMPKILTSVRTEEAKELRKKGIEVFANRELIPREDGISNTITTVTKDNLLQEPQICSDPRKEFGRMDFSEISPTVVATDYKSPKIVREPIKLSFENLPGKTVLKDEDGKGYLWQDGGLWRVRKLVPIECGRLMGCSDSDIQKMIDAGISKTALYSLFGNSIVVDVLYHIFRKLWIDTENESAQKSLFDF